MLNEILPEGPKVFPVDFVSDLTDSNSVHLPSEPVEVAHLKDGKYAVRSNLGYIHPVRNAPEGNYIYYSYLRGERVVRVPREMIILFRAVKGYENYLRGLRQSLLHAYERKSGHRPMAEH